MGPLSFIFFFFNDTATTEIYTLSLHDALPIYESGLSADSSRRNERPTGFTPWKIFLANSSLTIATFGAVDRKSTRLNSSHLVISYAVFCLKKKNISTLAPFRDWSRV